MTDKLRILALADSDSYLKWAAHTLEQLPSSVDSHLRIVRSRLDPSPTQTRAATQGTAWSERPPSRITVRKIRGLVSELRPDIVLVATTGPLARLIIVLLQALGRHRPAIITGLPGVSFPANAKALGYRVGCDAFIVHSPAEKVAFDVLAKQQRFPIRTVVARLPFLTPPATLIERDQATLIGAQVGAPAIGALDADGSSSTIHRVVFAPQALVPSAPAARLRILRGLAKVARARPDLDVVVKMRGLSGEAQTHPEAHPYDELWAAASVPEHAEAPSSSLAPDPSPLAFVTGPLEQWLTPGTILVTVSSTAAVEAMSAGLPTLIIDDLGFSDELLNTVYEDSGCTGPLTSLIDQVPRPPHQSWCDHHYLHSLVTEPYDVMASLAKRRKTGAPLCARPVRSNLAAPKLLAHSVLRAVAGRI